MRSLDPAVKVHQHTAGKMRGDVDAHHIFLPEFQHGEWPAGNIVFLACFFYQTFMEQFCNEIRDALFVQISFFGNLRTGNRFVLPDCIQNLSPVDILYQ